MVTSLIIAIWNLLQTVSSESRTCIFDDMRINAFQTAQMYVDILIFEFVMLVRFKYLEKMRAL